MHRRSCILLRSSRFAERIKKGAGGWRAQPSSRKLFVCSIRKGTTLDSFKRVCCNLRGQGWCYRVCLMKKNVLLFLAYIFIILSMADPREGERNMDDQLLKFAIIDSMLAASWYCQAWLIIQLWWLILFRKIGESNLINITRKTCSRSEFSSKMNFVGWLQGKKSLSKPINIVGTDYRYNCRSPENLRLDSSKD